MFYVEVRVSITVLRRVKGYCIRRRMVGNEVRKVIFRRVVYVILRILIFIFVKRKVISDF